MIVGNHAYADVWNANSNKLNDEKEILQVLSQACIKIKTTILHKWSHTFKPQGITALISLAESHAAIHTYPENNFYSVDIYTCGNHNPLNAVNYVIEKLGGNAKINQIERGKP